MTPDRYERIQKIFNEARSLPDANRTGFLDSACGSDDELRSEVESLLGYDESDPSFLNEPALGSGFRVDSTSATASPPSSEGHPHPTQIGHFRIKRVIGEGGMGIVYLAEQSNPNREVALKVLKAHIGTPSVTRRFELESELLARLQHPGIARIFETGTANLQGTPVPYFAMEHIAGQRLDQFVSKTKPTICEKLDLIVRICSAIQHAHQKGIVHRDLKPANILVDDDRQPHILDFGVARLADTELNVTLNTNTGQLIGTLPYMSPEQVVGDPHDIDTRTDIYAVGVIAYEMLTGQLPLDVRKTALLEAARMIRELDPPSLAFSDKQLAGDVDAIITKALEKDRDRRYGSAKDLADDIQRYLSDEPVTARPVTTTYQLRKFAKRNRGAVIAAALLLVVFLGGSIGTTVGMVRARRAETLAKQRLTETERQAKRVKLVNDFLEHMLLSASPRAQGPDVRVADILDITADKIPDVAPDEPLVQASIHGTIGFAFQGIGRLDQAEQQLRASVELLEQHRPLNHPETLAAQMKLADVLLAQGKLEEARTIVEAVHAARRAQRGPTDPATLKALASLAAVESKLGHYDVAIPLHRRAADALEQHADADSKALRASYYHTLGNLGNDLCKMDQCEEGIAYLEKSATELEQSYPSDDPIVLTAKSRWATALDQVDRHDDAARLLADVLAVRRRVLGDNHPDTLTTMNNYAFTLESAGDFESAANVLRQVTDAFTESQGARHPNTLVARNNLAHNLHRIGEYAESIAILELVIRDAKRTIPGDHWLQAIFAKNLGAALTEMNEYERAEELLLPAYDKLVSQFSAEHSRTQKAHNAIERLYEKWKKPDAYASFQSRYARTDQN